MQCAVHGDRAAAHTIGGIAACEECALSSTIAVFVSVAYLATLALAYAILKTRTIVGGIAAVVALVSGRALQVWLHSRKRRRVDASRPEK